MPSRFELSDIVVAVWYTLYTRERGNNKQREKVKWKRRGSTPERFIYLEGRNVSASWKSRRNDHAARKTTVSEKRQHSFEWK